MHTASGEVRFYKDENGLLYISFEESSEDAAALLVQTGSKEAATAFVKRVHQNYKGYTKREILQVKEAQFAIGMIGNPSKGNFKSMVKGNMINNCPETTNAIATYVHAIFGSDLPSLRGKTVR